MTAALHGAICTGVVAAGIAIRQPGFEVKLTPEAASEMAITAAETGNRPRSGRGKSPASKSKNVGKPPSAPPSRLHLCLTCGEHLLFKSTKQKSLAKRYAKISRFPQDVIFSCGGEKLRSEDREPLVEASVTAAAAVAVERRRGRGARSGGTSGEKQNGIDTLKKRFEKELMTLTAGDEKKSDKQKAPDLR